MNMHTVLVYVVRFLPIPSDLLYWPWGYHHPRFSKTTRCIIRINLYASVTQHMKTKHNEQYPYLLDMLHSLIYCTSAILANPIFAECLQYIFPEVIKGVW